MYLKNQFDIIEEINGYAGLEYERYIGGRLVVSVRIKTFTKKCPSLSDDTYFGLINSNGEFIMNAYNYLNVKMRGCTYKEREGTLTALKLLYSFLELFFYTDERDINKDTIKKFEAFLYGGYIQGNDIFFKGKATRTDLTLNTYQHFYRKYYRHLGIEKSVFDESRDVRKHIEGSDSLRTSSFKVVKQYIISKPVVIAEQVPWYITYEEYIACINYIKSRDMDYSINLRDITLIHLMYEYGPRIGELLGLTIEDVYNQSLTKSEWGQIIIRNRFTDKPWQYAKGCMKITNRGLYNRPLYKTEGIGGGFQRINIEQPTLQLLEEYMNETVLNSSLSPRTASNLKTKNIADLVSGRSDIRDNKYIFMSKNFTPITATAWNRILKEIYKAVGISIDKNKKEKNLSHRLRHGFAMFKVLVEGYSNLALKSALRHQNGNSCERYFNPTKKDLANMSYVSSDLLKNGGIIID